jgi:hypothetical protein
MSNRSDAPTGNPWLILAAIVGVTAVIVVVVVFLAIGGDTGGTSSY